MTGRQYGGWVGFGGIGQLVVQVTCVGPDSAGGAIVTELGIASTTPPYMALTRETTRTMRILRVGWCSR